MQTIAYCFRRVSLASDNLKVLDKQLGVCPGQWCEKTPLYYIVTVEF